LAALRLSIGAIWALNLLFIVVPANGFFPTFADSARGYEATSAGGPALAEFVASHAGFFSLGIAVTTAYLALAFLLGVSTRFACVVGALFSAGLLISQWGSTFTLSGGTDVGPHPIYLVAYLSLYLADSERHYGLRTLWPGPRGPSFSRDRRRTSIVEVRTDRLKS
jgi:hypothetical protein